MRCIKAWRVVVAAVLTVMAVSVSGGGEPAAAAGPRPTFHLPFTCGTSWTPTTYSTGTRISTNRSWPHENYLDFPGGLGGQPVLAAAGGHARLVNETEGKVEVNHGGEWTTIYQHMTNITVDTNGRMVYPGEKLGVIGAGKVGTSDGPHLHFAQLAGGVAQPPLFNGIGITWGAGISYTTGDFRFTNARTATAVVKSSNNCNGVNQLMGRIVQWSGDTKTQKTSWLVTAGPGRVWVPSTTVYSCLRGSGAPDAGPQSSTKLDKMPDKTGVHAICGVDKLSAGATMHGPSNLRSPQGRFNLRLQTDGQLVLRNSSGGVVWVSGKLGCSRLSMQSDGNLVCYSSAPGAIWHTGTNGKGATRFVVQDDGNLVLYGSSGAVCARFGLATCVIR